MSRTARAAARILAALAVLSLFSVAVAQTTVDTPSFCPLPGAATYAAELCSCKTLSKFCNPFCLGTYIECGTSGSVEIKQCPSGTLFSFYTQECEALPRDAPGVCPGSNVSAVVNGQADGNDVKSCDVPFCLCDRKTPGSYSNPFDASLNSYIVCEFVPGLPSGVQSQLASIVECPSGQIFSSDSGSCQPAPADAPSFVRTDPVACSGIECFCRGRKRGLYSNPWDSDRASSLRCNSRGQLVSLTPAFEGQYFNGRRFVPVPAGGLPPTCVLDSAGIRMTTRGIREAWEEMKAANSTPAAEPFPRASPPPVGLVLAGTTLPGRPVGSGRKLHQGPLSDCSTADIAAGCGTIAGEPCWIVRGNPCVGRGNGNWIYWRCQMLRCTGQCPLMSSAVKLTDQQCRNIGGRGVIIYTDLY